MSILAIIERGSQVRKSSLETVSIANELAIKSGMELNAVCIGKESEGLSRELAGVGINRLYVCESDDAGGYPYARYLPAVLDLATRLDARIILSSATPLGKDLSASIASKCDTELVQDCIGIRWDDRLIIKKAILGGKVVSEVLADNFPIVVTLRPNAFTVARTGDKPPEIINLGISSPHLGLVVSEITQAVVDSREISEARIIVAGGRGIGGPENWQVLNELCETLGAGLAASRAAVDSGWISQAHQVGLTGKVVSPDVYIACGISGAIQHLAGMQTAKIIVAINKDPGADIFKVCDYGIVGDLFEVVPLLSREIKRVLS